MGKPLIPCPNCGNKKWTPEISPQATISVKNVASGQADMDFKGGLAYDIYKCEECEYAMFFYRPKLKSY